MAKNRNQKSTPGTSSFGTPSSTPTPAPATPPTSGPFERSEFKGSGTAKPVIPQSRQITREQIARRAYDIYASRGFAPGDPTADWLEAERQLKAGL